MKQKTDARIKREERVKSYVNDLLVHCAQGKKFLFATKAHEYGIGTGSYKAIKKYVKETDNSKVFTWNTVKTVDDIVKTVVSPGKKVAAKQTIHESIKLETANTNTKKEAHKTTQVKMEFEKPLVNKLSSKIRPNRNITVTVLEQTGGMSKSKSYVVDSSKFMFADVDKSIQQFKDELTK